MAGKHKLSSPSRAGKKRKTATESSLEHADSAITTPLLRLPAELRNEIYLFVCGCEGEKAYLTTRNRAKLSHRSALLRVSRQVREEFTAILHKHVPTIVARVTDFDFGHVITFLNRCEDIELKTLQNTTTGSESREMVIELRFGKCTLDLTERWHRWINRASCPEKKGSGLKAEYQLKSSGLPQMHRAATKQLETISRTTLDQTKRAVASDILAALIKQEQSGR